MVRLPGDRAFWGTDAPWWWLRARWLYAALESGELLDHDGTEPPLRSALLLNHLGTMSFPDGSVQVADPYLIYRETPIGIEGLLPLPYDVLTAVAVPEEVPPRVAAALLVCDGGDITSWRVAGDEHPSPAAGVFEGYVVHSGTGCFASSAAAAATEQVLRADRRQGLDPITLAIGDRSVPAQAAIVSPAAGMPPLAVFALGTAASVCPTWVGLNAQGAVVVVLTDLMEADDPYSAGEAERTRGGDTSAGTDGYDVSAGATSSAMLPTSSGSIWDWLFRR